MSLVQLRGVHRYYGAYHVLGPVDLEIHHQDRIGLIGPNGSGKSSLLDIIAGAEPDEGVVSRARGLRIGYLRQETPIGSDLTLYQYALEAFRHLEEIEENLRSLEARMADPRVQSDPDALESTMGTYQRLLTQLQEGGGLEKEARAKGVLFGLGFREEDLAKPFDELSGGQRARAQLARTLLSQPDLLLLDEPTNHLDLEAVEWLQGFLSRFSKSLVLVSHDRYLLRAVADKIWEIEGTGVLVFRGGYDASREQAAQRREQMAKRYEAAQQERRPAGGVYPQVQGGKPGDPGQKPGKALAADGGRPSASRGGPAGKIYCSSRAPERTPGVYPGGRELGLFRSGGAERSRS